MQAELDKKKQRSLKNNRRRSKKHVRKNNERFFKRSDGTLLPMLSCRRRLRKMFPRSNPASTQRQQNS
jgi:hypothetical protein